MPQLLLFPDPRPLVERLGIDFFRQAPQCPGVYLMRDAADTVLYVGKARNLRRRLGSYRVANPERLPRRHLRLLRAVVRIQLERHADETAALAREAELLRSLKPRFNRAGTWSGPRRLFGWRLTDEGLELAVHPADGTRPSTGAATPELSMHLQEDDKPQDPGVAPAEDGRSPEWHRYGPIGSGAVFLHASLVRVLWCVLQPKRGLVGMPKGWFTGRFGEQVVVLRRDAANDELLETPLQLQALLAGETTGFASWVRERTSTQTHPFEVAVREADLETITSILT